MKTRSYRKPSGKTINKWHSISHEELNDLFFAVGWIGKRRERPVWLRVVLRDDRGPGFTQERYR